MLISPRPLGVSASQAPISMIRRLTVYMQAAQGIQLDANVQN